MDNSAKNNPADRPQTGHRSQAHNHDGCCSHDHESRNHQDDRRDYTDHNHSHNDHDHDHDHSHNGKATGVPAIFNDERVSAGISLGLLLAGIVMDYVFSFSWFAGVTRFVWYLIAFLPVGLPIVVRGVRLAVRGDVFTEFLLMSLASVGAFYIGEYPEGVAVMVFYAIGELFQDAAVGRAKRSIKALLDVRPASATVFRNGVHVSVDPTTVRIGEKIRIKPGERVPLDGLLDGADASFNTAALTGESLPRFIRKGEPVLAGMVSEDRLADVEVTKLYEESTLSRILNLVQHAQGRKAKTELFIRKVARVYTPVVVALAAALVIVPYFVVQEYHFNEWLYRALIFLVISCPCALVIAIPLGYFGGIGAGSRNGILFKGSSYLDRMTRVGVVVMDKTGTLTQGVFRVQRVVHVDSDTSWMSLAAALETQSTHPVARAIVAYAGARDKEEVSHVEEVHGRGLRGMVNGHEVLVGNARLLAQFNIDASIMQAEHTTLVVVAVDGVLEGYFAVADQVKEDAAEAVAGLQSLGTKVVMLSGDRQAVVDKVAADLHIKQAYGDLLPQDKVEHVEDLRRKTRDAVVFVGDGINDSPVLAISDVGIAMGGLGSDAAIETADVIIQTDQPSRIVTAIKIARATNGIVWQNIALAFGVKLVVMAMGAWGVATMWEAVFADVGVALLAILNAIRIQRMRFF